MRAPGVSFVQIFGLKMGPEFHKIFKLYEELEEAGQTATLTLTSKGGKSTIKLQLESPPSSPSTAPPTTSAASAPASGGHRLWDAHWSEDDGRLSLSRSFTGSSSSASNSSSSISDHSCSDEDIFEDLGQDVDSDRC